MVGQQIGRYKVVRLIGQGGMGHVYEAVDEVIERRVAIKILKAEFFGNDDMAIRFLNEARASNIIQHPSIVSSFEFGHLPDGSAYIVMEYLEGETLRQRLQRLSRLDSEESLRSARQICSALCAAHAKHIVHRDLKPANIMIVLDPDVVGGERVKVLDFGVAKLAENQAKGQASTRTGVVLGSPGYMSPEQVRNVKAVDERSDVYSLGVILYEMLAGRQPFIAANDAELLAMHMYKEPTNLDQLAPDVRPELAAFVHRLLRKQAKDRPSSQEALRFLNQEVGFPELRSMPYPIVKAQDKLEPQAAAPPTPAGYDGATNYGPIKGAQAAEVSPPKDPAAAPSSAAARPAVYDGAIEPDPSPNAREPQRRPLWLGLLALLVLALLAGGFFLVRSFRAGPAAKANVTSPAVPSAPPPVVPLLAPPVTTPPQSPAKKLEEMAPNAGKEKRRHTGKHKRSDASPSR